MNAYILDAVRTPRGAAKKSGALRDVKPIELLAQLLAALQERNQLETSRVDDIVLGCVTQINEQGANLAKIASLYAGWHESVSGVTLNRFCASGLDAVGYAALKIHAGMDQLVVAGGVESVSRTPMFADEGAWFADPEVSEAVRFVHMVISADIMASLERFEREELDHLAMQSHLRAARAERESLFTQSRIPVRARDGSVLLDRDELIREDTSMEKLSQLEPSARKIGMGNAKEWTQARYSNLAEVVHLHHSGNSPSLADGASLLLIGNEKMARTENLRPRARIIAIANTASDPLLLTGGQKATEKVLAQAGLQASEIDLFEVNEAFAATVLKYQRDLKIDPDKINPYGGAIAMGHALGATGGMLVTTLLDALEHRGLKRGLIAISGGAGVGTAMIIERC
jgi:acetyl-CoA C-acetyltransferase